MCSDTPTIQDIIRNTFDVFRKGLYVEGEYSEQTPVCKYLKRVTVSTISKIVVTDKKIIEILEDFNDKNGTYICDNGVHTSYCRKKCKTCNSNAETLQSLCDNICDWYVLTNGKSFKTGSYQFKHKLEKIKCAYVNNCQAIVSLLLLGIPYKRIKKCDEPNPSIFFKSLFPYIEKIPTKTDKYC